MLMHQLKWFCYSNYLKKSDVAAKYEHHKVSSVYSISVNFLKIKGAEKKKTFKSNKNKRK